MSATAAQFSPTALVRVRAAPAPRHPDPVAPDDRTAAVWALSWSIIRQDESLNHTFRALAALDTDDLETTVFLEAAVARLSRNLMLLRRDYRRAALEADFAHAPSQSEPSR